jgi:hypothetical protein
VITVPPPGIPYADSINGAFTIDVTEPPATESTTESEFDYVNEPGGFAFYATVGPLHLLATKGDAKTAGSSVRIRPGEYDVTVGQLVAIGSPVAPVTIGITVPTPETALPLSSPLTLASTQFVGGTVVLTYGDLVLHANLSSIERTAGGSAPPKAPDAGTDASVGPLPPGDGGNVVTPMTSKDAILP